jgi:predicted SAM-dependent methyltransferase
VADTQIERTAVAALSSVTPASAPSPLRHAAAVLRAELRQTLRDVGAARRLARAARSLADPLVKVHLGCGDDVRSGWLNVDMSAGRAARERADAAGPGTALVLHDLRRGLGLPPRSCSLIYSSHLLEHLEFPQALRLLRDCCRALAPGGVFRAALPDFRRIATAYVENDACFFDLIDIREAFPHNAPGTHALIDYVNYAAYQSGEHRMLYDADKMIRALLAAGFSDVRECGYDEAVDPDSEVRRRYSFYVEGMA